MNKKKLLALLMALVMTLSLIPTTVWADDEPALTGYFTYEGLDQNTPSDDQDLIDGEAVVISDDATSRNAYVNVAQIGDVKYTTLAEAVSKATDGAVIKMIGDTEEGYVTINKNLTIDLNNCTITAPKHEAAFTTLKGCTLTVQDNSAEAGGKITGSTSDPNGMNYAESIGWGEGTIVLRGGTLENTDHDGAAWATLGNGSSKIVVDGGTLQNTNGAAAIGLFGGTLEVKSGAVIATNLVGATYFGGLSTVTITGGSFKGMNTTATAIDGKAVAAGYKVVADTDRGDGWYKVVSANVAQIVENGTEYTTLAEAIEAAQDGQTVKLLQDIALESTTTINKSITIDGNNRTLTVTGGDSANGIYYALNVNDEAVGKKLDVAIEDLNMTTAGYQVAVYLNGDCYSTLALNNVNITCDGECIYANGLTSASANNCNFTHNGTYADKKDAVYYSALIVGYGGNLEVSNCTVTSFGNGASTFPSGGSITLTNTDITINEDVSNYEYAGYAIWSRNEDYATYPEYCRDSVITFHSGKVSGDFQITDKYPTGHAKHKYVAKIVIDGGVFSKSPANIDGVVIKTGYKVIENTDPATLSTYGWTIGVKEDDFVEVKDAVNKEVTHTNTDTNTTFSFATATTENTDDVTYAIKTTTTENETYTPVQTDVVAKPAVSGNAANDSGVKNITEAAGVKTAVETYAGNRTTEIQAKKGNDEVDLLTTQAAAKAITKAAAAYEGGANNIAKVEIQLQTELTSYTLADKDDSVVTTALIYQVTPKAVLLDASGEQLSAETLTNIDLAAQNLTLQFQLPVPDSAVTDSGKVIVTHHSNGYADSTSVLDVLGEAGNRYVVIETTHFSEFELKPYVVAGTNELISASLTLGTSLDINFYMQLMESVKSIRFTFTDEAGHESVKTVAVTADKYDSSTGQYKFSYPVAAKDIYQTIKLEMLDVDGHPTAFNDNYYDFPYSVTQYLNTIIGDSGKYGAKMVSLAEALGVYGSYAHDQILGTSKHNWVLENPYGTIDANSYDALNAAISASTPVGGYGAEGSYPSGELHNPGMTLLLRTETVVANRFDYAGSDFSNYKFYYQHADANGNFTNSPEYEVKPVHTGSYWYVESNGIPAAELNRTIKFIVKNGDGVVYSTNYGPMFYAKSKVNSATASDLMKNTVRALYEYNQKAIAVFDKN